MSTRTSPRTRTRIALLAAATALSSAVVVLPGADALGDPGIATRSYFGGAGVGDGGPALDAFIAAPGQLTVDPQGRRVFADPTANEIRRIEADGTIVRVAGNGDYSTVDGGFSGDGGPATSARLSHPQGVQVGADGTIYIADTGNHRIRAIAPDGTISTIAGTGVDAPSSTETPALSAAVSPKTLRLAPNGDLYFSESDLGYADVRRLTTTGSVQLVAGNTSATANQSQASCPDTGGLAVGACLHRVNDLVVDADGDLFLADYPSVVYQVSPADGQLTWIAGNSYDNTDASSDGVPAAGSTLAGAYGLDFAADGRLLVATSTGIRVLTPGGTISTERAAPPVFFIVRDGTTISGISDRVLDIATDGTVTKLAGAPQYGTGDGLPIADAQLGPLSGIAAGPEGGTVLAETRGRVWLVDAAGIAHRLAGTVADATTFAGEAGPARSATLPATTAVAAGSDGSVYVGTADGAVRRISAGVITTVAGTGTPGNGPDATAPATTVAIGAPRALAVAADGTVEILDQAARKLRALDSTGSLTTVAGSGTRTGHDAVGHPMSELELSGGQDVSFAPDGSLLLAQTPEYPHVQAWAYRVLDGTVTQATAINRGAFDLAQDSSGRLLVSGYPGLFRLFGDGSSEYLADNGLDPLPVPGARAGSLGGDGRYLWSGPAFENHRIWALALPSPAPRPPSVTGVKVLAPTATDISWTKPTASGLQIIAISRAGATAPSTIEDGDQLDFAIGSNSASIHLNPPYTGTPVSVSIFVRNLATGVVGPPVSVTVVPRYPATCTATASAATVIYGQRVRVTGYLKNGASAIAGHAVTLSAAPYSLATKPVGTAATASDGSYGVWQSPSRKTRYTLTHTGDTIVGCSGSTVVAVKPIVTSRLSATTIAKGARAYLTAGVSPSHAGQRVYLQRLYGTTWKGIAYLSLNVHSQATFAVSSTTATTMRFRVYRPADGDHVAAYGPVMSVSVR